MADGEPEIRFWSGWPTDTYGDCEDPPKILFDNGAIAMSDDSAVDPDAAPPVSESCCCCAECKWCQVTKKPSMVRVTFSGVANGDLGCSDCGDFNTTTFELHCSRSGSGCIGGGICSYETTLTKICTYTCVLYDIHTTKGVGDTPFVKIARPVPGDERAMIFYRNAGLSYDIDCTETRTDLVDIDQGDSWWDYCDWRSASTTVNPDDCEDS